MSYVLPYLHAGVDGHDPATAELVGYLCSLLDAVTDVVVVDASDAAAFAQLHGLLPPSVRHVQPAPGRRSAMGKVDSVLAGVRAAREPVVVIADDDVRYDPAELRRVSNLMDTHDVVRPQNYFEPLPWHALWDTARTLLNRLSGGDWTGTIVVRRDLLLAAGGYDGDVMFENLELERTMRAAGARVAVPLDLCVRRRPGSTRGFLGQRVRQAYDELARPPRLVAELAILPALFSARRKPVLIAAGFGCAVLAAEAGRRRRDGRRYFPARAAWFAPLWLLERGACAWLAVGSHVLLGGVRYRGRIVPRAANSVRTLECRVRARLQAPGT